MSPLIPDFTIQSLFQQFQTNFKRFHCLLDFKCHLWFIQISFPSRFFAILRFMSILLTLFGSLLMILMAGGLQMLRFFNLLVHQCHIHIIIYKSYFTLVAWRMDKWFKLKKRHIHLSFQQLLFHFPIYIFATRRFSDIFKSEKLNNARR